MNSEATPIRAPQEAIAWTPGDGWLYDDSDMPRQVEGGDVVLVVSDDGWLRGVQPHDRASFAAVLRIDADVANVVTRLDELGDQLAGDVRELRARMTAAVHRVGDLEDRAQEIDTGLVTEVVALRARVRKLEERTR